MSIVLVVFPSAPKPSAEAQRADRELDDTLRTRITGCYHSLLHACAHKHRHLDTPTPDVNAHTPDAFLPTHDSVAHVHTPDTVPHSSDAVAHPLDTMTHIPDIDADTSDSDSKSDSCNTPVTDGRGLPNDAAG